MKALHLNLASRPYRDYRPLYAVVVAISLAIALLAFNNIDTWYRYRRDTETTRARIAQLESDTARERQQAQAATGSLGRSNVAALASETRFINAQLAERAFSWSELLDRLERVLPADVRIRSIAPAFLPNGLVHLEMSCEAKTGQGMVATIRSLTSTQWFSGAFPHNEQLLDTGGYLFSLGVDYKPSRARVVRATQ